MQSNDTMIKEKVTFYAEKIDFPNFKASDHWICKWKKCKGKYAATVIKKFIFLS